MSKMITSMEAVRMMTEYEGHGFVAVQTRTEPDFIGYKKDKTVLPRFQQETGATHPTHIVKLSEYNAQLGLSYPKLIERRLVKQGKDISEYERGETWHEPYGDGSCPNLRQHKGTKEPYFYLFLTANTYPAVRYVDTVRGVEVDSKAIKPFLAASSAPKNQGLDEGTEVLVRTLKLSSLISIKMDGEEYTIA